MAAERGDGRVAEGDLSVHGVLTDGFDSTTRSMRTLGKRVRVGTCLRHALLKLPKTLVPLQG
jgi:hypothetical protein